MDPRLDSCIGWTVVSPIIWLPWLFFTAGVPSAALLPQLLAYWEHSVNWFSQTGKLFYAQALAISSTCAVHGYAGTQHVLVLSSVFSCMTEYSLSKQNCTTPVIFLPSLEIALEEGMKMMLHKEESNSTDNPLCCWWGSYRFWSAGIGKVMRNQWSLQLPALSHIGKVIGAPFISSLTEKEMVPL